VRTLFTAAAISLLATTAHADQDMPRKRIPTLPSEVRGDGALVNTNRIARTRTGSHRARTPAKSVVARTVGSLSGRTAILGTRRNASASL